MNFTDIKKWLLYHVFRKNYLRAGSCKGCGRCCEKIYVRHGKGTIQSEEEYKKLRFLHPFYTYLEPVDKDETGLVFTCTNLDPDSRKCKIHKSRPQICRRYPQEEVFMMGGHITQECGFKFLALKTFDYELKKAAKKIKSKIL